MGVGLSTEHLQSYRNGSFEGRPVLGQPTSPKTGQVIYDQPYSLFYAAQILTSNMMAGQIIPSLFFHGGTHYVVLPETGSTGFEK